MKLSINRADYLFLDCEWADVCASELVSIAIVSIDDLRYFYGELDVLPSDPTPWVRSVVYPLLERGSSAMPMNLLARNITSFLLGFDAPVICYDFCADRRLCELLLAREDPGVEGDCLDRVRWSLIGEVKPALSAWWNDHPNEASRRHHALVDARALRSAFLSLWGV